MVTASIKKYITLCFSVHSRVLELLVHCQNLPGTWAAQPLSVCSVSRVSNRLGSTLWGGKKPALQTREESMENVGPLPAELFICLKNLCGMCAYPSEALPPAVC